MTEPTCSLCGKPLAAPPGEGPAVCLRCRNTRLPDHLGRLRANLIELDRLPGAPDRSDDDDPPNDDRS